MTDRAFKTLCTNLFKDTEKRVPIDTGNMRYNSLKMVFSADGKECHIYIDEAIAPYVFYTNEPWTSAKWNGKKNPNEGWWDKCAAVIDNRIQTRLKNVLEEVKVND